MGAAQKLLRLWRGQGKQFHRKKILILGLAEHLEQWFLSQDP